MERICIVLGGSFNPPTLAHQRLLTAVVEEMGAEKGIFLPCSHNYLAKKMSKAGIAESTLPEEVRLAMLEAVSSQDPRLTVDDHEFHCYGETYTYESMVALQEKDPQATFCLLLGSDKLKPLPHWHEIEALLERFHVVIVKREGEDAEKKVEQDPLLSRYRHHFHFMNAPEGTDGVSSTAVRKMLVTGDPAVTSMCSEAVLKIHRAYLDAKRNAVKQFREEYFFLSNFYEAPVTFDGICYANNEAAFQAQKCLLQEERMQFSTLSPGKAKSLGRRVALRADWEDVKVGLMEAIVRAKFTQNHDLGELLLATGDRLLEEGNTWNDTFWGVSLSSGSGKNTLGKILMKVREELRTKAR